MAESERAQGGGPDARPDVAAPSFELELPAVASSVAAGRHAVRKFCDGHSLDHGKIAIAVSEALTNVVVHAYRDSGRRADAGLRDDARRRAHWWSSATTAKG